MAFLIPPPNQEAITGKDRPSQWWVNWFNAVKKAVDDLSRLSGSGSGGSIDMGDWLTGSTIIDMGDRY